MRRKLSGQRCQCATCGEYFNSTYAFDLHRAGDYGVNRRCLTVEGMQSRGMALNATGWWVSQLSDYRPDAVSSRGETRISASEEISDAA